jgi:DNA-binding GntR family transcriptional regulator
MGILSTHVDMTGSASSTEEIYGRIHEALIACRLRPGTRLKAES